MIKSVAGFLLLVSDTAKSKKFYQDLGFNVEGDGDMITARMNWFKIQLLDKKASTFQQDVDREPKGAGVYFYLRVDEIDKYYSELKKKGFSPSAEPKDWPWGNREFALKDPDGYKLVFFEPI